MIKEGIGRLDVVYTKSCTLWSETFSIIVKHLEVELILENVDGFGVCLASLFLHVGV